MGRVDGPECVSAAAARGVFRFRRALANTQRRPRMAWRKAVASVSLLLCGLATATHAVAEARYDFLGFPALSWKDTSTPAGTASDLAGTIDLFATVEADRFRLLGEWYFTERSNEIQRLQLGWRMGDSGDTLWVGRFHTPIGYWNTAYHHGTYLQTSISRPAIEEFEGGDGPLPTHLSGLLWEGVAGLPHGALHYSLAAGLGPRLDRRLDPLDVAEPESGHGPGVAVNVSWRPAAFDTNQVGAFAGRSRLRDEAGETVFEQDLLGVYAHWGWQRTRLTAAVYHVSGRFEHAAGSERVSSGYLQAEWSLAQRWTPYVRVESTHGARADDPYLGRFRNFVTQRELVGLRYELSPRQALTVEASRYETLHGEGDRIALQWSAYFP